MILQDLGIKIPKVTRISIQVLLFIFVLLIPAHRTD